MGVKLNGSAYFFVKNLQGDVVAITDYTGSVVARYTYDVWGKLLSVVNGAGNPVTDPTHVANLNPFRYRGYFYDTETGLYYLQSRYYDAQVGRFVNGDGQLNTDTVLGNNLFVYSENNPINAWDPNGKDAIWLQDKETVLTAGHTGLLLQDSEGRWWHFYWGNNRSGKKGKKGDGAILLPYSGLTNLASINVFYYRNYRNKYEDMIYFKGDFSKSVEYAKKLNSKNYSLITNNCMQVSTDVLRKGRFAVDNWAYQSFLIIIRINPIPNIAYRRMVSFHSAIERWHSTPWYLKWTAISPIGAIVLF